MTTIVLVVVAGPDKDVLQKSLTSMVLPKGVEARVLGDFTGDDIACYGRVVKTKDVFNAKPRKEVQSSFKFGG